MRAVIYERYGPPEVLQLKDIPRPVPGDNQILAKIHSTTVTAGDWRMRKADPFYIRIVSGFFRPKNPKILGFELAGIVEEVGKEVKSFKRGDEVFAACGFKFGAYAEYKCLADNDSIVLKPKNMSFDEAATVPIGGITALRFLRQTGIKNGENMLIYGASGSVGTYAIQLAKHFGATVTAVCSTSNKELVKSLGANNVIDYTKEDFTKTEDRFDLIFDAVGKTSKNKCKHLLKPGGRFITVGSMPKKGKNDLQTLKDIIEAGELRSVIDRKYTLEQIQDAHRYVESFRKRGNVVVKVVEDF